jgi:NADPH:quinone reductase-like Zn-dependent oxidoreductase
MSVHRDAAQLAIITENVERGDLQVDISSRHPLSELALVHKQSEAGQIRGKVLLIPTS